MKGKYLSFLFIDAYQNGGLNIQINTITIHGYDGYVDLSKIGKGKIEKKIPLKT